MTEKIGNVILIEAEDDDECQLCHKMAECRPAGPNGERVCFACAKKNPEALKAYTDKLFGRKQ